ncbi:MAG TPA: S8 family serine peptidase [Steroidobacteraceae bacterium]|nr:S8 family serine peptidase [Steroidobacteraceae bacterium]
MKRFRRAWIVLFAGGAAASALAQVGVPVPQLPLPPLPGVVNDTLRTAQSPLTELRKLRVLELLRRERATLEADPDGHPIERRRVGALSPTPAALASARAAGFTLVSERALDGLGLRVVVLEAPQGMSTRRALRRMRSLDPQGQYDFVHLYLEGGAVQDAPAPAPSATPAPGAPSESQAGAVARVGLIDSGVDGAHPALAGSTIVRHGCDGRVLPAPHGTAVASLLAGDDGAFRGAHPRATLYAADVFCGHGGGSIALLAVALDWMAREQLPVVNISLVGAKSVLLTGLVRAMSARGHLLVAAVGNDGPAAPPLYPAAYAEVVGVTGVDANDRVLPEACRGEHVDFAAPGAGIRAAQPGGGFAQVRGTSFATPIVAGLLAGALPAPDPAQARQALEELAASAVDLGRTGTDTTYGRGLVGGSLRAAGD